MAPRKTPPKPSAPPVRSRILEGVTASVAARRVPGFGFTAFDDDLFALGYPHLALLCDDGEDPVAEAQTLLLDGYPYRQVVFPQHAAVALLRARQGGPAVAVQPDGSAKLTDHALAATEERRPLELDEARALLSGYARIGEVSIDVFLCIVEALFGTAEALGLAADALETLEPASFFRRAQLATTWLDTLALMLDRLPAVAAEPHARRLRAWADRAGLTEPARTALGVGSLYAEPCIARPRLVVHAEREALVRARTERAHEPWYSLPDPRLVFLGGDPVYAIELNLWRKYGHPYAASVAHRLILERFGRIRSPLTVSLALSMATKSTAKRLAQAWLEQHRDFAAPHLAELASGDGPLAEAARRQ